MENLSKVIGITNNLDGEIVFDSGHVLTTNHEIDCCEWHYWSLTDLSVSDFDGLLFDLKSENFFSRIEGYGISLNPVNGFPIRIPCYGDNNGYYSDNLTLILNFSDNTFETFDITECQSEEY